MNFYDAMKEEREKEDWFPEEGPKVIVFDSLSKYMPTEEEVMETKNVGKKRDKTMEMVETAKDEISFLKTQIEEKESLIKALQKDCDHKFFTLYSMPEVNIEECKYCTKQRKRK